MFSLGDVPQLANLAAKAQQRATLADVVKAALSPEIRPHIIGASWRGTTLVVMVDSGAWTALVRFAEKGIRRHLKEANEPDCARLWVRVVQPPSLAISTRFQTDSALGQDCAPDNLLTRGAIWTGTRNISLTPGHLSRAGTFNSNRKTHPLAPSHAREGEADFLIFSSGERAAPAALFIRGFYDSKKSELIPLSLRHWNQGIYLVPEGTGRIPRLASIGSTTRRA